MGDLKSNLEACTSVCDEKTDCKYFFYNDNNWCAGYSTCDFGRIASSKGDNYKKQGNLTLQYMGFEGEWYSQKHQIVISNDSLSLELPSFLARPNKLCSDDQNGYETLESLEECKMAANYLPKSFAEEQTSSRYPKGCYFSTIDNQVYYNSHSTGDKDFNARPICRAKGKEKIFW